MGVGMKKVLSWIFFVLMVAVFLFDIVFAVDGVIDVQKELDRLAATPGVSGVDYLGVGMDILLLGIAMISVIGLILAIVSYKLAQNRVMRIASGITAFLFLLPILPLLLAPMI